MFYVWVSRKGDLINWRWKYIVLEKITDLAIIFTKMFLIITQSIIIVSTCQRGIDYSCNWNISNINVFEIAIQSIIWHLIANLDKIFWNWKCQSILIGKQKV